MRVSGRDQFPYGFPTTTTTPTPTFLKPPLHVQSSTCLRAVQRDKADDTAASTANSVPRWLLGHGGEHERVLGGTGYSGRTVGESPVRPPLISAGLIPWSMARSIDLCVLRRPVASAVPLQIDRRWLRPYLRCSRTATDNWDLQRS